MNALWAVFKREIAERRFTFPASLVVGLPPVVLTLIPGPIGETAGSREIHALMGLVTAASMAATLALMFGAGVIVRPLVEKRLSFHFARPLPALAIWAGRLLAAVALALAGGALAGLPMLIVEMVSGNGGRFAGTVTPGLVGAVVLAIAFVVLAAHAVSSVIRLRTPWAALDALLFFALGAAFGQAINGLATQGFWDLRDVRNQFGRPFSFVPLVAVAILLAASYVQVADGRTDTRRSHGALSATLWGLSTLLVVSLAGLAWWVASAAPSDLVTIEEITVAPRGAWVRVRGPVRARGASRPFFFYDTASARFMKSAPAWFAATFSADASREAWFEPSGKIVDGRMGSSLRVVDFSVPTPLIVESDLTLEEIPVIALSPSGRRLAVKSGENNLAVYDIADPAHTKQLLAVRIPETSTSPAIHFFDEDRVRLLPHLRSAGLKDSRPRWNEILELDIPSRGLTTTAHFDPESLPTLSASADGRFLVGSREGRVTLHDARTGAVLATIAEGFRFPRVRFLSGNLIAVAGLVSGNATLQIFDPSGRSTREIRLGAAKAVIAGREISEGRIAIGLNPFPANNERAQKAWSTVFVDVRSGEIASTIEGISPADRLASLFAGVLPAAEAGTDASRLFLDSSFRLICLDPTTGERKVLLGRTR